jgi:predicted nucleic acid-binding protein
VNLVVDASVAVKWVVEEEDRDRARALLLNEVTIIAPAFLMIEAANVMSIKVSRGQLEPSHAAEGLEAIRASFAEFVADEQLAAEALQLALKLNHPAYDCTYLACANQKSAEFVTADKKFLNKLRSTGEWPFARALTD